MSEIVTLTMNPALDVSTSVERVMPIHKLRCGPARRDPGGGGINVARVVRRLDGEVSAIYPAGGPTGEMLHRLVDGEGIRACLVPIAGETRESFTVFEESSGEQFRFVLPGAHVSEIECKGISEALAALEIDARYVVASGSLPPGMPEDFFGHLAKVAKTAGARFVIDTSGPALAGALEAGVFLVKPSERELSEHLGRALPDLDSRLTACRALIAEGKAEMVALTLGAEGALLVSRNSAWRADAPMVEAVSAVGAGDSFLGALVLRLDLGDAPDEALRHGVAAGAAALLSPGTELCHPDDVKRLLPKVSAVLV